MSIREMNPTVQYAGPDSPANLPTYSVVIPVHGDGEYLVDAVHSALHQTHAPREVILVNDAASPVAVARMSALRAVSDRICVVDTEGHSGAGIARNTGMEAASGKYIAFLDSDDIWVATKMAEQLTAMLESGALLGATQYGTIKDGRLVAVPRKSTVGWVDPFRLLVDNPVGTSSAVVHRNVKFRFSQLKRCQDWEAWIELGKAGHSFWIVDKLLTYHRVGHSPHSLSSSKVLLLPYQWRILRNSARRGFFSSFFLMSLRVFFAASRLIRLRSNFNRADKLLKKDIRYPKQRI